MSLVLNARETSGLRRYVQVPDVVHRQELRQLRPTQDSRRIEDHIQASGSKMKLPDLATQLSLVQKQS